MKSIKREMVKAAWCLFWFVPLTACYSGILFFMAVSPFARMELFIGPELTEPLSGNVFIVGLAVNLLLTTVIALPRVLFFPGAYDSLFPDEADRPGRLTAAFITLPGDVVLAFLMLVVAGLGAVIGSAIFEALTVIIPISWTAVRLLTYGLMAITGMACLWISGWLIRNPPLPDDEN